MTDHVRITRLAKRFARILSTFQVVGTVAYAAVWLVLLFAWLGMASPPMWLQVLEWFWFGAALPLAAGWILWATWPVRRRAFANRVVLNPFEKGQSFEEIARHQDNPPLRGTLIVSGVSSIAYIFLWHLSVFVADAMVWDRLSTWLARVGTAGLFFIGLAWLVWSLERAAQRYESTRTEKWLRAEPDVIRRIVGGPRGQTRQEQPRVWNPLDPNAWYYGRNNNNRRLNQSLTGLVGYSFAFMLAFLVFSQIGGCRELYEMPAGGGEQKTFPQVVKVQKVIKRKYVVNPFSAILFHVPPIDEVKLQLTEVTSHLYKVGYGKGTGSGFSGGTSRGKVRFIRLEYSGGDWNQDFGVGADLNMLIEYGVRTKHKVAEVTESRTIAQLKNFPLEKSPPLVYLTGQKNISLSNSEEKILREYLLEKHGMLFGDNGGSRHFHNQFLAMMNHVLPKVRPVPVPLDDVIHRVPYKIPFLPYVAPHGGSVALGWKVDGRWVCYYHPGDIGDAWSDDHAGVSPEIYEYCYQLGTNIIFYAHTEYNKWLDARRANK